MAAEATLPPLATTLVKVMAPSSLAEMSTTLLLARPEYLPEWMLTRLPFSAEKMGPLTAGRWNEFHLRMRSH